MLQGTGAQTSCSGGWLTPLEALGGDLFPFLHHHAVSNVGTCVQ